MVVISNHRTKGWIIAFITIVVIIGLAVLVRKVLLGQEISRHPLNWATSAFANGGVIPKDFTCDGLSFNPEFTILNVPKPVKNLALVVEDLDLKSTNPFSAHWMVWNIPPTTTKITQGIKPDGTIGRSIDGNFRYAGPCPPPGEEHRYSFTLYALGSELPKLNSSSTFSEVKRAVEGKALTKKSLIGRYRRPN